MWPDETNPHLSFFHASADSSLLSVQQEQYKHMVSVGETRAPHQHMAMEEQAPRPGLRMHSETAERSKLPRHR